MDLAKKLLYKTLRNRIPQTPAQTDLLFEHLAEPRPTLGPRLGPGRAVFDGGADCGRLETHRRVMVFQASVSRRGAKLKPANFKKRPKQI